MNTGRFAICDNHIQCRQDHGICKYGLPHRVNSWPPKHIRCTLAPPGQYAQAGRIPRRDPQEVNLLICDEVNAVKEHGLEVDSSFLDI